MKTIAHLPPQDARMIDLTRHLNYPHGSLSPQQPSTIVNDRSAIVNSPRFRQARQDAESFTNSALWLFLLFLIVFSYLLSLCF